MKSLNLFQILQQSGPMGFISVNKRVIIPNVAFSFTNSGIVVDLSANRLLKLMALMWSLIALSLGATDYMRLSSGLVHLADDT